MIVAILDTETNGREPGEVIELAALINDTAPKVFVPFQHMGRPAPGFRMLVERFKPTRGSTFKVLAVHGILDGELSDKPPSSSAKAMVCDIECIIAHNAPFDVKVLGLEPPLVIDTLALSRAFCPDDEGHTLGAMMFRVGLNEGRQYVSGAHEAASDVLSCAVVLDWLVERFIAPASKTWASLAYLSEALSVPQTVPFGKYKGQDWGDVDFGYLKWYLNQADQDPAVRERMLREQAYRIGSQSRCPHCDGIQAIKDDETGLWSLCSCFVSKR